MLLNVSRTPAPESWLANLETEPPSYSALDKDAYVTVCHLVYPYFTDFMYLVYDSWIRVVLISQRSTVNYFQSSFRGRL